MEVTDELKEGLEKLSEFEEYKQISIEFNKQLSRWSLRFSLSCEVNDNPYVPSVTNWYALISAYYPHGDLELYPDKENSITKTFTHQSYNSSSEIFPWREGNICVKTPLGSWEQRGFDSESPSALNRLAWNVNRAIVWLRLAAAGRLTEYGDLFEFPPLPKPDKTTIIFNETKQTFDLWHQAETRSGVLEANYLNKNSRFLIIKKFLLGKNEINYDWGDYLKNNNEDVLGIWALLKSVPVLPPWQVPCTWKQLYSVGKAQGINLKEVFYVQYKRSFKQLPKFLLIGFPVPDKIGGKPIRFAWFSILLKKLPLSTGFLSQQSEGYLNHCFQSTFALESKIQWSHYENWSKDQITNRGLLDISLNNQKMLLIGVGSVGSLIGELMVRLGIEEITVIDKDILQVGNFSRHTLTIDDLDSAKAKAVSDRLNSIFPYVKSEFIFSSLEEKIEKDSDFISGFQIIIDASASNGVLDLLSKKLKEGQSFISISIGLNANRLFLYLSKDTINLKKHFEERISVWMDKENQERKNTKMPMEGIGCWHPLFPARYDSIAMLVSASINLIEQYIKSEKSLPELIVIIRDEKEGIFKGLKVIRETHDV